MRAESYKTDKLIAYPNEKKISLDMTFPTSFIIMVEHMGIILLWNRFSIF